MNEWIKKFRESRKGKLAIEALEELGSGYDERLYRGFEAAILRHCYDAARYAKNSDPHEKRRDEVRVVKKRIPDQVAAIRLLRRYIEQHPEEAGWAGAVAILNLKEHGISVSSETRMPIHEILDETLKAYAEALSDGPIGGRGNFLHRHCVGPLLYASPIDGRRRNGDPLLNGLLFGLTWRFREWTAGRGVTVLQTGSTMPDHGRPCYREIALLIEAVLGKRYTEKQLGSRLEKLLRNNRGIAWGHWPRASSRAEI